MRKNFKYSVKTVYEAMPSDCVGGLYFGRHEGIKAGETCFRSLRSSYEAEAHLNGCPFSLAHTTFTAVASDAFAK